MLNYRLRLSSNRLPGLQTGANCYVLALWWGFQPSTSGYSSTSVE